MQLGLVIGHATSTIKHPSMEGWRMYVVQMLNNARLPEADPVIAMSGLNAAVGQTVILDSDGKAARDLIGHPKSPVRYFIIAIENDQ
jgi:ethanolamine utilization protein EutN